ncbi:MAG: Gfo/Idh/MocA family oxidoreductase [Clostridia bacterium]|nr:Gfo/Idh/MocA family oxidoreductase [Clostridia bacterium]
MDRIRYGVIGTGWRALFFVRAAKLLPELFDLVGVVCRNEERAAQFAAEHGVRTFARPEELIAEGPEYVVSCMPKAAMCDMVTGLLGRGVNVLSETPLAVNQDDLMRLWEAHQQSGAVLQLAEQYFLWPTHQARRAIIDQGLLGDVCSCWISDAHDYHGISLLRHYLQPQPGEIAMSAHCTTHPIVVTGGRDGVHTDGEIGYEKRTFAQISYPDGKLGLYDFSGTQYHSRIRTRHLRVIGTRGEIFDREVRWVDAAGRPQCACIEVRRDVAAGTVRAVDFEGQRLYTNPFPAGVPMTEDEIAVFDVMLRMGRAVRGGEPFYSDAKAFGDTYLSTLLWDLSERGASGNTQKMPWDA